jgi:hypothetical protein
MSMTRDCKLSHVGEIVGKRGEWVGAYRSFRCEPHRRHYLDLAFYMGRASRALLAKAPGRECNGARLYLQLQLRAHVNSGEISE